MKPIEEVRKGDWVWSTDQGSGEMEEKQIEEVFVNETNEIVHVRYGDTEVNATPTHPFYVAEKGWVCAVHLRAGDRLQLVNGEYVTVEQVQHEILESPVKVYNFRVADNHTYYVGHDNAVLVHNASCGVGRTGKQARLKQLADDDKLPRYLRGEIKRDMNEIVRGKRKTIRVPQGYELSHKIGKPAHRGYSYAFSDLNIKKQHRMHHKVFGYKKY